MLAELPFGTASSKERREGSPALANGKREFEGGVVALGAVERFEDFHCFPSPLTVDERIPIFDDG
jgi:hypothetical protein